MTRLVHNIFHFSSSDRLSVTPPPRTVSTSLSPVITLLYPEVFFFILLPFSFSTPAPLSLYFPSFCQECSHVTWTRNTQPCSSTRTHRHTQKVPKCTPGGQKRSLCDVTSPFDPADFYSGHVPLATSWRWRSAQLSSPSLGGHKSVSVWSTGDAQRHFCPRGTKNVRNYFQREEGDSETLWSEESLCLRVRPSGASSASGR